MGPVMVGTGLIGIEGLLILDGHFYGAAILLVITGLIMHSWLHHEL